MTGPMFGVPGGTVRVENPDGVYQGMKHNLYDGQGPVAQPIIPGDFVNVHECCERAPEAE